MEIKLSLWRILNVRTDKSPHSPNNTAHCLNENGPSKFKKELFRQL